MKMMEAAQFKESCPSVLEELDPDGLIVTQGGNPIAKVLPYTLGRKNARDKVDNSDLFGILRDKGKIKGDIMSTGLQWSADVENLGSLDLKASPRSEGEIRGYNVPDGDVGEADDQS